MTKRTLFISTCFVAATLAAAPLAAEGQAAPRGRSSGSSSSSSGSSGGGSVSSGSAGRSAPRSAPRVTGSARPRSQPASAPARTTGVRSGRTESRAGAGTTTLAIGADGRSRGARIAYGQAQPRSVVPTRDLVRFGYRSGLRYSPYYFTGIGLYDPWYFGYGYGYRWRGYPYGLGYHWFGPFSSYGPLYDPAPSYGGSIEPLRDNQQIGSLRLRISPRQARVYVDGALAGIVDNFDGLTDHLKLPAGPHQLEFRADGYQPLTIDVVVAAGKTMTERGSLRRLD